MGDKIYRKMIFLTPMIFIESMIMDIQSIKQSVSISYSFYALPIHIRTKKSCRFPCRIFNWFS